MASPETYRAVLASLDPGDGLVLVDLDRFGQINQTLGTAEGDRLLSEVASHLRGTVRDRDSVVRFGGDEFMAVLRGAGDESLVAACRISHAWKALGPVIPFSTGVSVHQAASAPEQTFSAADAALFEAKQLGGGQVVLSRTPDGVTNPGLLL